MKPQKKLRVLLEMRPALDGHAGIPQETRLLFRSLQLLQNIYVEGLIQSTSLVLAKGLPTNQAATDRALSKDKQINRLSRVVVSLQQKLYSNFTAALLATAGLMGFKQVIYRFETAQFRDFIWRRFFAKTLPYEDFNLVTSANFRVLRTPWTAMHIAGLATKNLGGAKYSTIDTNEFDLMIGETPYPGNVSPNTKLVIRYHDAIPLLMPHTISDKAYHQASHYHALKNNVERGALFACVSEASRQDLLSVFPQAESRAVTIHNMVSHSYFPEESSASRVPEIVRTRRNRNPEPIVKDGNVKPHALQNFKINRPGERATTPFPYLLVVSTIEPRKNHSTLVAAWERLRVECFPDMQLVVVGMMGWSYESILPHFAPWTERGQLHLLQDVPAPELRVLYKHASATVCPSFGEGFDFSGVEAMRCGGIVAASDIPVHREIYDGAAEYFSPYSSDELFQTLATLLAPSAEARRAELVAVGADVSSRYLPSAVMPQWEHFLNKTAGIDLPSKNERNAGAI